MIGYHFRKIQERESDNPLAPPIEVFKNHLPRINSFWFMQLLGENQNLERPFDLINVHKALQIKKGELGRWVELFKETLKEYEKEDPELIKKWEEKIIHLQETFLLKVF